MLAPVLLDSYDNVLLSPTYLKTWGPKNGFDIRGIAAYLWGSDVALCGQGDPPTVTPSARAWLQELTEAGMGCFGNLEIGADDPSVLGGPGGVERANTAVACYKALNAPAGAPLCISNDAVVSNQANVIAFYTEADQIIRSNGWAPTAYCQSSVFELLQSEGLEYLWHAPDGTVGPPWPKNTIIAQRPNYFVQPLGDSCDVDDIIDVSGLLWNLNGLIQPPPTRRDRLVKFEDPNTNRWYLANGHPATYIPTVADLEALTAAGIPTVKVSQEFADSLLAP